MFGVAARAVSRTTSCITSHARRAPLHAPYHTLPSSTPMRYPDEVPHLGTNEFAINFRRELFHERA